VPAVKALDATISVAHGGPAALASLAAGFDHHLVKPPNIERLRELLGEDRSRVER